MAGSGQAQPPTPSPEVVYFMTYIFIPAMGFSMARVVVYVLACAAKAAKRGEVEKLLTMLLLIRAIDQGTLPRKKK